MHIRKQYPTLLIILPALLLAVLLLGGGPPPAQSAPAVQSGLSMTVEVGFGGVVKSEQWIPVYLTVSNEGPDVEGQLRVVSDQLVGAQDVVYEAPVSLPSRSHKRVPVYVYGAGYAGSLTAYLVDEQGNVLAEADGEIEDSVRRDGLLFGVVTSDPAAWTFLEQVDGGRPAAAAALMDRDDLPDSGAAWSALDILILHEIDSGQLSNEQQAALRGWLGQGGQLVVAGGSGWQATTAGLQDLLPVAPGGTRSVDDLPALRALGGEPFRDEGPYLVTTSELRNGQLVLYEEELPLLAQREWGRGAVYFLALDPAQPPLLDWRGNEALWSQIASAAPRPPIWAQGPVNGFSAASAVSTLPSLTLPSAGWLFLFLLLYVAVVGPGNYLALKAIGRRELAWVTIPATIVVFAALAYVTGFQLRGGEVIFNQMSVAFGHVEGEQMRANSLLGVYSPRRATYDVSLPESVLVRPFERNYGQLTGSGNQAAISRGSQTTLEDLRVDVSGVETYVASSYQPLPSITGRAVLSLEGSDARMEVTVQNNGEFTLENAGIFYGSSFEPLGDLNAGASASADWQLTQTQASATAGATTGVAAPTYSNAPPLNAHYDQLLGTNRYHEDPEARPRFQLLESMQSYGPGPPTQAFVPRGAVTLVGWAEQSLFDVTLRDSDMPVQQMATTLYFLELPVEDIVARGEDITVPAALMSAMIVGDSGVYASSSSNFHLPPGWIEMEFEPWPTFQDLTVTALEISLRGSSDGSGGTGSPAPEVRLWNWDEETWSNIPQAVWGTMGIGDFQPFIGEQNRIRMRLENNSTNGMNIREAWP
ncbi:MAG: DUF7408 domain-containing protein, partial [bacterium]